MWFIDNISAGKSDVDLKPGQWILPRSRSRQRVTADVQLGFPVGRPEVRGRRAATAPGQVPVQRVERMRWTVVALFGLLLSGCAGSRSQLIEGVEVDTNVMYTARPTSEVEACLAQRLSATGTPGEFSAMDALGQRVVAFRVRSFNDQLHRWRTEIDGVAPVPNAVDASASECLLTGDRRSRPM